MPKRMRMRRRILRVLVCAALSWCVVPRTTMAAPQCGEFIAPVPPVEGQTVNAARDTLEKAGLKLGRVNPSNGTGVVFQQSLAPNRCVPIGTSVDIWIKNATPAPAATEE